MQGRAFLDVAREVVAGLSEAHWRCAVVNAYYAILLEAREALQRWGFHHPPHQTLHAYVRLRLTYARDVDLKSLGLVLDNLVKLRNRASYDLTSLQVFSNDMQARNAIFMAESSIALLDRIDADPARRAAAVASLPP